MNKLVCLFAFVALLGVGTALKCYSCDKDVCLQDKEKWTKIEKCGGSTQPSDNLVPACLKRTYKEDGKEFTSRKCVFAAKQADGKLTFDCKSQQNPQQQDPVCTVCTDDYCNSAPVATSSVVAVAVGALLSYLLFAH